jgi:hypothetical protein
MGWKRKLGGGVLTFVGFMLSPLSWWNDLFVNVPLAAGAAWLVAWFHPPAFRPALIAAYWLTNVLGLVLMHLGLRRAAPVDAPKLGWKRELLVDIAVSLGYTLLIVLLVQFGILKPFSGYFTAK